jgi:SAM-dependent methyltransferase
MKEPEPQRHSTYGVTLPDLGWVPAPSYLLRRDRILRILSKLPVGPTLEIGCGAGALIDDLVRRGFRCQAVETSPDACRLARTLHGNGSGAQIHSEPLSGWGETFDYVLAFEVLEHIEHDHEALAQWWGWLKAGGYLLISVPAHWRRWSASDVWAGHYRRYEREGLADLLRRGGFQTLAIECYGFPLANFMEPIRAWLHKRTLKREGQNRVETSAEQRHVNTQRSGTQRGFEVRFYPFQASVIGTALMRLCFALQSLFIGTDFGPGYLVVARKC